MSRGEATGTFEIDLTPGEGVLPGTGRNDFRKTWSGQVEGTSRGVMLSGGDPAAGAAGYVCVETFDGSIDGRRGTLVFQQFGVMSAAGMELRYEITPGSGTGELAGLTGVVDLEVVDGVHRVTVRWADDGS